MTKFFFYETDFTGRWRPVFVQNMNLPTQVKPKPDKDPERSAHWEVPLGMTLTEAQEQYPAPESKSLKDAD